MNDSLHERETVQTIIIIIMSQWVPLIVLNWNTFECIMNRIAEIELKKIKCILLYVPTSYKRFQNEREFAVLSGTIHQAAKKTKFKSDGRTSSKEAKCLNENTNLGHERAQINEMYGKKATVYYSM